MPFRFARALSSITHRRSNGIPVPLGVSRLIRSGNRARGEGDWARAELSYRAAVAKMPDLLHIWIQAGHAGKETGNLDAATDAYSHAALLGGDDPEPHIHLGHVAKLSGRSADAAGHYFQALRRRPDSLAAAAELMRTADAETAAGHELIDEAIAIVGIDASSPDGPFAEAHRRIYFDVTDLLAYFSHARLPTGIQRVQIELVIGALNTAGSAHIGICCFSEGWRGWRGLSRERFLRIAIASLIEDDRTDPAWRREVISALLELVAGPKITFESGTALINVGSSWSERNYFLHLRNAREHGAPFYIPVIYDLIPMKHPEWFPAALVRDYRAWIVELFAHADAFFAISNATAEDLRSVATEIDPISNAIDVTVLPLNGDFRSPLRTAADHSILARWKLTAGSFVLMISTIEPRKNHFGLLEAWRKLLARFPEDRVPILVCVGGRGWMNEPVHALLARDSLLRSKVLLLHGVGDADLALLYGTCLFTVYPSFYEGWGLPVTESLCYGKVPVISRTSSMPEAGGRFAVYFDPHDVGDMAETLGKLIDASEYLALKEHEIAGSFIARSWTAIAGSLLDHVDRFAATTRPGSITPPRKSGRYSFRADSTGDIPSAERFRVGTGWAPPGPEGAGILEGGARIRLPRTGDFGNSSIGLRVSVRPGLPRKLRIEADGKLIIDAVVPGGMSRWFSLASRDGPIGEIIVSDSDFRAEQRGMGRPEASVIVSEIAFSTA